MEKEEQILNKWNEENGYDIEDTIIRLGYKFDGNYDNNSNSIIKLYSSYGDINGMLVLSEVMPPVFISYYNGIQNRTIIFDKNLKVSEEISIPSKKLGLVEYGTDLKNPKYMKFYSDEKVKLDRASVLPDAIKKVDKADPLGIICEVTYWAADIRRSLAPSHDIILSK